MNLEIWYRYMMKYYLAIKQAKSSHLGQCGWNYRILYKCTSSGTEGQIHMMLVYEEAYVYMEI
jgi:hypothetical protein